jgi:hypothetical protein
MPQTHPAFPWALLDPARNDLASLRGQAEGFWQVQERILCDLEGVSKGWFKRRHEGTAAAIDAARAISSSEHLGEAAKAYQKWLLASNQRFLVDLAEMQAESARLVRAWIDAVAALAAIAPALEQTAGSRGQVSPDSALSAGQRRPAA